MDSSAQLAARLSEFLALSAQLRSEKGTEMEPPSRSNRLFERLEA